MHVTNKKINNQKYQQIHMKLLIARRTKKQKITIKKQTYKEYKQKQKRREK